MKMLKAVAVAFLIVGVMVGSLAMAGDSEELDKGSIAWLRSDYAEAFRIFRPLAEQGNADAQNNLGVMYGNGHGVPQDYAEAVRWYRLAAEQGHAGAQSGLGFMYIFGQGVPQDNITAYMWFNLAAAQGNDAAINNRDSVVTVLTAAALEIGQRLSRECLARNYKNC